jgi:hypothetical protein
MSNNQFLNSIDKEFKRQQNHGRCLHFLDGKTCNQFIKAHSIQKRGQLDLIAEEGHVYRLYPDNSGQVKPKKIGINKATTFYGFCQHHDNKLFELIDNYPLKPDKQQIALYAYRCLCREYFIKRNNMVVLNKFKNKIDLTQNQSSWIELYLYATCLGFKRLTYHKRYFDDAFKNKDFNDFEFISFFSGYPDNVQLSGLIFPEFDFSGEKLQDLVDTSTPLDLITFFTAPSHEGGWTFTFCWHASSHNICFLFIKSLVSCIQAGMKIEDALLRLTFSCCENHAFRISWWDGLREDFKQEIILRFSSMANARISTPSDYLMRGCENIANWKFEHFWYS